MDHLVPIPHNSHKHHTIPPISYYALNTSHRRMYSIVYEKSEHDNLCKYFKVSDKLTQKNDYIYEKHTSPIVSTFNAFFNENSYWYL